MSKFILQGRRHRLTFAICGPNPSKNLVQTVRRVIRRGFLQGEYLTLFVVGHSTGISHRLDSITDPAEIDEEVIGAQLRRWREYEVGSYRLARENQARLKLLGAQDSSSRLLS